MKIAVIDITNKVPLYNKALMKAINNAKESEDTIDFYSSDSHLLSIVPRKIENSKKIAKRALKAWETLLNWFCLFFIIPAKRYNVVHFQWLPFLEISSIEVLFIRIIKIFTSSQLVFTIHNVYPHGKDSIQYKEKYSKRFCKIAKLFDKFIVHTNSTKTQLIREFGLPEQSVYIIHHGIFEHRIAPSIIANDENKRFNIIMYGNQDKYKGTDIFVDSLALLSNNLKEKVSAKIVGRMDSEMYAELTSKECNIDLEIIPHFVPEEELYRNITESDLIVLPYRDISQSGVLLLALSFRKCILTSDLPSFKETLEGFDDNMFFKVGDAHSMSLAIGRFVQGEIDVDKQLMIIDSLNRKYSWESAGRLTYNTYKK